MSKLISYLHLPSLCFSKGTWKVTFLKKSDKELVFRARLLLLVKGWPCFCCCPPGEICWTATWPGTCKVVPVTCWELRLPARAWALRGWREPVTACAWPPTLTWTGKNVIPPFSLAIPTVYYKGKKDCWQVSVSFLPIFRHCYFILTLFPSLRWLSNKCQRTQSLTLPSLPCTGMVTVCPLLAVTVAVAMVTKVCPGTGVTDTASPDTFCTGTALTRGCGGMRPDVPPSEGLSFSNSRRLIVLAVGELYLSYNVVGDAIPTTKRNHSLTQKQIWLPLKLLFIGKYSVFQILYIV